MFLGDKFKKKKKKLVNLYDVWQKNNPLTTQTSIARLSNKW